MDRVGTSWVDRRRWWEWGAGGVAVVAVLGLAVVYGGRQSGDKRGQGEADGEPPLVLAKEYESNPVEADSRFKGRLVTTRVRIDEIARDGSGRPYVAHRIAWVTPPPVPAGRAMDFPTPPQPDPTYFFYLASDDQARGLAEGAEVTVTGRCLGYRKDGVDRGATGLDWRVEFEGCTIAR